MKELEWADKEYTVLYMMTAGARRQPDPANQM